MPTRSEIHKLNKSDLVELGVSMFEDEGTLLKDLKKMTIPDLRDLILDSMSEDELVPPEDVSPQVTPKKIPGPLDLGS